MPTWDDQLREVLSRDFTPGQAFSLRDVYAYEELFARLHPENGHVQSKLRQTLQHLRDEGTLTFLNNAGTYSLCGPTDSTVYPDVVPETVKTEGKRVRVYVNKYERDPAARAACIAHFGPICQVCEVDMANTYGSHLGAGFVHVHHRVPLATASERETDPERDLIPVCPNCHAMLHREDPPISVESLREIVKNHRYA